MTREQIFHEALEEIANPIAVVQRRAAAEGKRRDGMGCVALAKDPGHLSTLAQNALDKARKLPAGLTVAELQRESYETARDKGWHEEDDQPPSEAMRKIAAEGLYMAHRSMLIELFRVGRFGGMPGVDFQAEADADMLLLDDKQVRVVAWLALVNTEVAEAMGDVVGGRWQTTKNENGEPEGLGSELADIIIRVCDDAGAMGIDLAAELRAKLDYNRTRSHKHGGKLA